MDDLIVPQKLPQRNPAPVVTLPFDQDGYPIPLTPTQAAIVAFACEQANSGQPVITTRLVAEHFGLTLNAAYKRLRRLRDKGVFYSQLLWITRDNGQGNEPRRKRQEAPLLLARALPPTHDRMGQGARPGAKAI
jgi:hypothetical protein